MSNVMVSLHRKAIICKIERNNPFKRDHSISLGLSLSRSPCAQLHVAVAVAVAFTFSNTLLI